MKQKLLFSVVVTSAVLVGSSLSAFTKVNEVFGDESIETFDVSKTSNTSFMSGSEALERITGETLVSNVEKEFLDSHYQIKYDLNSNAKYNLSYLGGYYWLEAFPNEIYSPKYVSTKSGNVEFVKYNNQLIARLDSLEEVKIVYEYTFDLDVASANKLLTSARSLAQEEISIRDYNKALLEARAAREQYEKDLASYNTYMKLAPAYNLAKARYSKYVSDLNKYTNVDVPMRAQYEEEMEAYYEQAELYAKYLELAGTIKQNSDVYDQKIEEYNEKMKVINMQLAILDVIYEDFGDIQFSIDYFINTGAVDTVISRRSEIVLAGVDGAAVDSSKRATESLRGYINEYKKIDKDDKKARYNWYQLNFNGLKNAVCDLTSYLEYFYTMSIVRSAIENNERTDKYLLLVAELIYLSELLSTKPVKSYNRAYYLDSNRLIGGVAKTYHDYIGNPVLSIDIDPTPLYSSYPVVPEGAIIIEQEEVERPVEPKFVPVPIKPEEVPEPGENPADKYLSVEPTFVAKPTGELKESLGIPEPLVEHVDELIEREPVSEPVKFTITNKVSVDESKLSNLAVIFDTSRGSAAGLARLREFAFFGENAEGHVKTKPSPTLGVIANGTVSEVLPTSEYGEVQSLDEGSLIGLIGAQYEALSQFNVVWKHVLLNETTNKFEPLDSNKQPTIGYDFSLPYYNADGSDPIQRDYFVKGVRKYTYKFIGFDYKGIDGVISGLDNTDEIAAYQGSTDSVTISAVFKAVECFNVTFGDKTVSFEKGSSVSPFVADPVKLPTSVKRFEFVGWKLNGSNQLATFPVTVNSELVFNAVFDEINLFTATFMNEGKVINTQKLDQGSTPVSIETGDISKSPSGNSFYEFKGWDKPITALNENVTYNAVFEEKHIFENAIFSENITTIILDINEGVKSIDLSNYLALISKGNLNAKSVDFNFENETISLTAEEVLYLSTTNAKTLSLERVNGDNKDISVKVSLLDKEGHPIDVLGLAVSVTFKALSELNHIKLFNGENQIPFTTNKNNLVAMLKVNTSYTISYFYTVSFDKYMSFGSFYVNGKEIRSGESIELKSGSSLDVDIVLDEGVDLINLYSYDENGNKSVISNKKVVVGEKDLTIYANVEKVIYTINYYVEGVLYQTIKAGRGTLISAPTKISKPSDGIYNYIFVGWDTDVLVADGNYEVNAIFEKVEINPAKEEEETDSNGLSLAQKVGISALALVVGAIGGAIAIVVAKTRKKSLKK